MEFIGGLGVGAVVTYVIQRVVQHLLEQQAAQRDRRDRELKEAYTGFLEAMSQIQDNRDLKSADVNLRYWLARVQLVCSKEILEQLWDMGDKRRVRNMDVEHLVFLMRHDLKVAS